MSEKTLTVEKVVVGPKSRFGFKVGDTWYNVDRPLTLDNFQSGVEYEVRTYSGSKGGKRIAEIVGQTGVAKAAQQNGDQGMFQKAGRLSAEEYDAKKSRRILRQGVYQAVVQSPILQILPSETMEDTLKNVETLAEAVIAFIEK